MTDTFLILGMGSSGKATRDFLIKKGFCAVCYDDHDQDSITLKEIPWDRLTAIIQSPGIPFHLPKPHPITALAKEKGIAILSDIDLFQRYKDPHILCIGITGTNGKSTTTALITHMLNVAFNASSTKGEKPKKAVMGGNIGIPALSLLINAHENDSIGAYVLELSSYQLEVIHRLDLDVAVYLNLTPDHLDRHGSMEEYHRVKEKIFGHARHKIRPQDLVPNLFFDDIKDVSPLLVGNHNAENVRAAMLVCDKLGIAQDIALDGVKTFQGLAHRMEIIFQSDHLVIVNDSKATNADATERALLCYLPSDVDLHWILGGVAKDGGITSLAPYFPSIASAYLIGTAALDFEKTLVSYHVPCTHCKTIDRAITDVLDHIETYAKQTQKKHVILFSPACASLDQFKNFEHRGDVFKDLIKQALIKRNITDHGR